jgi:hypothetical protein
MPRAGADFVASGFLLKEISGKFALGTPIFKRYRISLSAIL